VELVREEPGQGERLIARLGPEEYFGEMALLTDAPRSATVRCVSDVTALFIARQNFLFLYSSIPAMRESIDSVMRKRV
ncbi:MAG: cyclic nucleotide-binding domain-containing protein, partial [Candidatus Riflebacteria bacterium]|nr:cyclic nucleotide-binding domain-containing protein [Candidatus Riflebacteria bacterium]